MASLVKITGRPRKDGRKPRITWRIDFEMPDDPIRKHLRLDKELDRKQAESVRSRIEHLIAAKVTGIAPDLAVSTWVASQNDKFHAKLEDLKLVGPRMKVKAIALGSFLDEYILSRNDLRESTRAHLRRARTSLIDFFSYERPLHDVTPGDADEFRRQLKGADNTVRRICGRAKQFFRAAVRKRLIIESPFADMKATSVRANHSRDYFVTRKESNAVLEACPDNQWQLLFALCRFGGLRCPSEPLTIRWGDVDWARDRILINSPKTGPRTIPIFPELRPYLEAAWDEAEEGSEFVITRYRDRNCNLRTQLCRIIKRAKLTPWPKLFQNLRSTRETELMNEGWKIHQVCAWIGNSEPVAMEHYLQVTEQDFAKAAGHPILETEEFQAGVSTGDLQDSENAQHWAQQNTAEDIGTERQDVEHESENPGDSENHRDSLVYSAPPLGLEPRT